MARTKKTETDSPKKKAKAAAPADPVIEEKEESPAPAAEKKTFTEEEVAELVKQAAAKAVADALAAQQPIRVYANPNDEMVTILYLDACADDNVLLLPNYGSITPGSFMQVPKREFAAQFMSLIVRKLLKRRKLIVVDGLTEDERIRWGVNYNAGELLDLKAFDRMLDLDTPEIVKIFNSLCTDHKKFVVSRFMEAYFPQDGGRHDNRIGFEKAKALNEASRSVDPNGMFQAIVDAAVEELKK